MVMAPDSYREFIMSLKKNVAAGRVPLWIDRPSAASSSRSSASVFEHPFGNRRC
jgi:hypothetical protein